MVISGWHPTNGIRALLTRCVSGQSSLPAHAIPPASLPVHTVLLPSYYALAPTCTLLLPPYVLTCACSLKLCSLQVRSALQFDGAATAHVLRLGTLPTGPSSTTASPLFTDECSAIRFGSFTASARLSAAASVFQVHLSCLLLSRLLDLFFTYKSVGEYLFRTDQLLTCRYKVDLFRMVHRFVCGDRL